MKFAIKTIPVVLFVLSFHPARAFSGAASLYSSAASELLHSGNAYAAELAAREALAAGAEQAPEQVAGNYAALGHALTLQSIVHKQSGSAGREATDLQILEAAVSLHRALAWTAPHDLHTANSIRQHLHSLKPLLLGIQPPQTCTWAKHGSSMARCTPQYFLKGPAPPCELEAWLDAQGAASRDLLGPLTAAAWAAQPSADAWLPEPVSLPPRGAGVHVQAEALFERGYRQAAVQLLCTKGNMQVAVHTGEEAPPSWAVASPPRSAVLKALTAAHLRHCRTARRYDTSRSCRTTGCKCRCSAANHCRGKATRKTKAIDST